MMRESGMTLTQSTVAAGDTWRETCTRPFRPGHADSHCPRPARRRRKGGTTGRCRTANCLQRSWIGGLALVALLVRPAQKADAQQYSWEEFVERFSVEDYEEEGVELSAVLEELEDLHEHPFNLNEAGKEELEKLPFLDEGQVEEILAYIYRHGPMQSLGELALIEELDYQTRLFLSLFAYVGNPTPEKPRSSLKKLLKEGRHEVMTRLDVPLYKREGYKIPDADVLSENPNKVYLGNSLYHNIRYAYRYGKRLYWGFTAEKDAGEPFGSYGNKAYDSYSFHFLLKDWGKLKVLALGDYKLGFGEGLVVNSDFHLGKSTFFNMSDAKLAVKKFSSTSENSFFRGIAATFRFGNVDVSAFYSRLPLDATLGDDGTVSTLKTDGLHRTLLELSKKHDIVEQSAGADVVWNTRHLSVGASALYQHFDRAFSKGGELYRQYYPEGKDFLNASLHYRFRLDRFSFSGETAYSDAYGSWATLNKAMYRFSHKWSMVALQRLFSYRYVGLRANSFSEGGAVRNESGFYAGIEASPLNELKMSAYVDYFYFPWAEFGTPHVSDGVEAAFRADWDVSARWNLSGRYQLKRKERYGKPYLYHKLRIQASCIPSDAFEWRALGACTRVRDIYGRHVGGYMGGSILKWKGWDGLLDVAWSFVYFHSDDYKAPMSFYEPSLLYAFSFMTMYGEGMRTAVNVRLNLGRRWMAMAKYGSTGYFDRDEIGDGLQRIEGRWKNDLSFLLRYKF